MSFKRVSILGVGLLGGSIGLAVRQRSAGATRVVGYGHRAATLERAMRMGAIDESFATARAAVAGADLVILCTPVGLFGEILADIGPALPPGTIVTDVGSTKRSVVSHAEEVLPATVHFVGSHPMAGSEKRGVEFARADLFERALCLITPTPSTDSDAMIRVEQFWQSIGMRTRRLDPNVHDRMIALASHLPHAIAAALVDVQSDESIALAGRGFLDATRIAGGDGGLWRDIFVDNQDHLRAALGVFRARLDRLESMLTPEKSDALKQWLDDVARRRESRIAKDAEGND